MKSADNQNITIVGDNNNIVITRGSISLIDVIKIVAIASILLVVFHCCPELLADVVRWIISAAIGS